MKKQYIDKADIVTELKRRKQVAFGWMETAPNDAIEAEFELCDDILSFINNLEVKEVNLTDIKTEWYPSKKQMESLNDMLKYNIGVFDYQKFMEVNSLYDDLTKILDYETDRQEQAS